MQNENQVKALVQEKYGEIANQKAAQNRSSCCGATGSCSDSVYSIMADDYSGLEGYRAEADLGLGCGLPTAFAQIKAGDTVIDLGSGAGNDAFIARQLVGEKGMVIGVDFTPAMIERARENAAKLGFENVQFRQGDIEDLPVANDKADVIVSNCVLNLVPNKQKVFSEMFRVLKPGGHFSISDIVLEGELPESWRQVAELYAGCISGAIQRKTYLELAEAAGFVNLQVQKEKAVTVPDEILLNYFMPEEVDAYKKSAAGIKSITLFASKPQQASRCEPGAGCC